MSDAESAPDAAPQDREKTLARIAHDLRTPLSVITTTSAMLLNPKYQFSAEQVQEQLTRIGRNAEQLNRLVGELSELVKRT